MSALTLYHGSRGGLRGPIRPVSRSRSDFGKGFYLGTRKEQAITLVANDPDPYYYEIGLDIEGIPEDRILVLNDMDWAFFVLYNRGRLDEIKGTDLYNINMHLADNKDLIIGPIADDAMNEAMDRFIHGLITDKAFVESIRGLDFGTQYVIKTEAACSHIEILQERKLAGQERQRAILISEERRRQGRSVADKMQELYRREGNYLDEILADLQIEEEEHAL